MRERSRVSTVLVVALVVSTTVGQLPGSSPATLSNQAARTRAIIKSRMQGMMYNGRISRPLLSYLRVMGGSISHAAPVKAKVRSSTSGPVSSTDIHTLDSATKTGTDSNWIYVVRPQQSDSSFTTANKISAAKATLKRFKGPMLLPTIASVTQFVETAPPPQPTLTYVRTKVNPSAISSQSQSNISVSHNRSSQSTGLDDVAQGNSQGKQSLATNGETEIEAGSNLRSNLSTNALSRSAFDDGIRPSTSSPSNPRTAVDDTRVRENGERLRPGSVQVDDRFLEANDRQTSRNSSAMNSSPQISRAGNNESPLDSVGDRGVSVVLNTARETGEGINNSHDIIPTEESLSTPQSGNLGRNPTLQPSTSTAVSPTVHTNVAKPLRSNLSSAPHPTELLSDHGQSLNGVIAKESADRSSQNNTKLPLVQPIVPTRNRGHMGTLNLSSAFKPTSASNPLPDNRLGNSKNFVIVTPADSNIFRNKNFRSGNVIVQAPPVEPIFSTHGTHSSPTEVAQTVIDRRVKVAPPQPNTVVNTEVAQSSGLSDVQHSNDSVQPTSGAGGQQPQSSGLLAQVLSRDTSVNSEIRKQNSILNMRQSDTNVVNTEQQLVQSSSSAVPKPTLSVMTTTTNRNVDIASISNMHLKPVPTVFRSVQEILNEVFRDITTTAATESVTTPPRTNNQQPNHAFSSPTINSILNLAGPTESNKGLGILSERRTSGLTNQRQTSSNSRKGSMLSLGAQETLLEGTKQSLSIDQRVVSRTNQTSSIVAANVDFSGWNPGPPIEEPVPSNQPLSNGVDSNQTVDNGANGRSAGPTQSSVRLTSEPMNNGSLTNTGDVIDSSRIQINGTRKPAGVASNGQGGNDMTINGQAGINVVNNGQGGANVANNGQGGIGSSGSVQEGTGQGANGEINSGADVANNGQVGTGHGGAGVADNGQKIVDVANNGGIDVANTGQNGQVSVNAANVQTGQSGMEIANNGRDNGHSAALVPNAVGPTADMANNIRPTVVNNEQTAGDVVNSRIVTSNNQATRPSDTAVANNGRNPDQGLNNSQLVNGVVDATNMVTNDTFGGETSNNGQQASFEGTAVAATRESPTGISERFPTINPGLDNNGTRSGQVPKGATEKPAHLSVTDIIKITITNNGTVADNRTNALGVPVLSQSAIDKIATGMITNITEAPFLLDSGTIAEINGQIGIDGSTQANPFDLFTDIPLDPLSGNQQYETTPGYNISNYTTTATTILTTTPFGALNAECGPHLIGTRDFPTLPTTAYPPSTPQYRFPWMNPAHPEYEPPEPIEPPEYEYLPPGGAAQAGPGGQPGPAGPVTPGPGMCFCLEKAECEGAAATQGLPYENQCDISKALTCCCEPS